MPIFQDQEQIRLEPENVRERNSAHQILHWAHEQWPYQIYLH